MKRLHVHVTVADLDKAVGFYRELFGQAPTVLKDDYAKWRIDDPMVNFAVSARGRAAGVDHLGIEVEAAGELAEIETRLAAAEARVIAQKGAACCYAKSDKAWSFDPDGVVWETFLSHQLADEFGADTLESAIAIHGAAASASPAE